MKLANIVMDQEIRVVGVHVDESGVKYVDLHAREDEFPPTVESILFEDPDFAWTKQEFDRSVAEGNFVTGEILPPLFDPGKILCIGLNYKDHALETKAEIPFEPVVFSKFSSTITAPEQPIILPRVAQNVDYEAELVVVIGVPGKRIDEKSALRHVAGYCCGNDVSARDWQRGRPGGQWLLGKTPDTFAPLGPWFVTADEIKDPQKLGIQLRLNGETMQNGNTSEMIFPVAKLIAHVSQLITLETGDIIFTGTPAGVGVARDPKVFLKSGDVVEVEIEGLGVLRNHVIHEDEVIETDN